MPYKDEQKQKEYKRIWHQENKQRRRTTRSSRRRAWLDAVKAHPCTDCGVIFAPCAMQFDHINDDKIAGVTAILRANGIKAALTEIAKCELVCANCHALRTQKRSKRL